MTDETRPVSDEDVSSVVDGLADDDTAARVRAQAGARLTAFEDSRRLVGEAGVAPLPADIVDELVANAVAALTDEAKDDVSSTESITTPQQPVRDRARTAVPAWLVAAAVVVMMAIGITLIGTGRNNETASKFTTVGSSISADDSRAAEESAASAPSADAGAAATTTVAGATAGSVSDATSVTELGDFADPDALRVALRVGFGALDAPSRELPTVVVERCQSQAEVTLALTGDPTNVGVATVAKREVLVYVYPYQVDDHPDVTQIVVARGRDACDPVLTFQR